MINAAVCKAKVMLNIEKYCTENIEPLLVKSDGVVYFGQYTKNGNYNIYITKTYAKDPPKAKILSEVKIHPFEIKAFLEMNGYTVSWVEVEESYPAGYSSSGKTHYYNKGYNTYYSLKISC